MARPILSICVSPIWVNDPRTRWKNWSTECCWEEVLTLVGNAMTRNSPEHTQGSWSDAHRWSLYRFQAGNGGSLAAGIIPSSHRRANFKRKSVDEDCASHGYWNGPPSDLRFTMALSAHDTLYFSKLLKNWLMSPQCIFSNFTFGRPLWPTTISRVG